MGVRETVRRVGLVSYAGFAFNAAALLQFLNQGLRPFGTVLHQGLPWVAGISVCLLLVGALYPRPWLTGEHRGTSRPSPLQCGAIILAIACWLAASRLHFDQTYPVMGFGTFIVIVAMVLAWRVHALWYLAFALGIGGVIGSLQHDWRVGVAIFGLTISAMASTYWVIRLVLDHRSDAAALTERWRRKQLPPNALRRAAWLWLPALVLSGAGFQLHNELQSYLKWSLYRGHLVTPGTEEGELTRAMVDQRDIQADLVQNLDAVEAQDKADFVQILQDAYATADAKARAAKEGVAEELEEQKPGDIPSGACEGFQFKVMGKRIASNRTACYNLMGSLSGYMKDRYARMQARLNEIAQDVYDKGAAASAEKRATLEQEGLKRIGQEYDAYRYSVRRGFQLIELLRWVGNLALIGALIAGLQMVLGRLLFDSSASNAWFQLSNGNPAPARYQLSKARIDKETGARREVLSLRALAALGKRSKSAKMLPIKYFYAAYGIHRFGAPSDACVRDWSCFLQRLLTNRLALTRIDPNSTYTTPEEKQKYTNPCLSVAGDSHLVAIELQPGQEIHFRMADLAAFSDRVKLTSIYSTHVAGYLLGLGNFQCIASGSGYLILKSCGVDVGALTGVPVSSSSLLAWDRRSPFRLHQALSVRGIWLNDPDLLAAAPNAALLDQDAQIYGFWGKAWRLLRYLFLPI